jgi:hypothetical protein
MSRWLASVAGALALLLAAAPGPAAAFSPGQGLVELDRAFGNTSPFVGAAGAIRGVNAAGLPWSIREAHVTLTAGGQLTATIEGLVIADDPSVPPALRGVNPVPQFAVVVSCLTTSAGGIVTTNVTSANFAASPAGDAFSTQQLAVPAPCVAPVVLLTSPNGGVYFAVTGSAPSTDQVSTLRFDTAFGNTAPFIGAAGAINGVNAAGLPWAIAGIFGDVAANGQLDLSVQGLVLANDPSVPPTLRLVNPVPTFVAVVSCMTVSAGQVTTVNVVSAGFPADRAGNAFTNQMLALPQPCVAPVVFVGPSATTYFAVTGA